MEPILLVHFPRHRDYRHTVGIQLATGVSLMPPQLLQILPQTVQGPGYSEPEVTDFDKLMGFVQN